MKLELAYAQALYDELHKKPHESHDKIFKNFTSLLERKGHTELMSRIGRALDAIENHEARRNTVVVTVAKGGIEIPKEYESVFEKNGLPKYEPCQDENLVGGFVAKGKGFRVDGSYKTALLSLYQLLRA